MLKTNMISAAAKKTQCLLYFGVYLAACFRRLVQHCGMKVSVTNTPLSSRRPMR